MDRFAKCGMAWRGACWFGSAPLSLSAPLVASPSKSQNNGAHVHSIRGVRMAWHKHHLRRGCGIGFNIVYSKIIVNEPLCINRSDLDGYNGREYMGIKVRARYEGSALKPIKEIGLKEGEEVQIVVEKSAVDKFHGMIKIPKKLADEIIEMEMLD